MKQSEKPCASCGKTGHKTWANIKTRLAGVRTISQGLVFCNMRCVINWYYLPLNKGAK